MSATTQSELRLASLLDEREQNTKLHETVIASVEASDNKMPSESQSEQIQMYREKATTLDTEIEQLADDVERNKRAVEASKAIRRAMAGSTEGVEVDGDGIVYRDFYTYARDFVLANTSLGKVWAEPAEIETMAMRQQMLKRTPANTLSSNVTGLTTPAQHIDQIFQVINKTRPIVATARRVDLIRGQITYPVITTRPVVAVQASEKTEAGNTGMVIDMVTATASTYLGGGDISWQAVNWSTPSALQMWFDLAAEDYAKKTEADAAQVILHSGFLYNTSTTLGATPTFAEVMTAVGAAYTEVFTNSGRLPDTFYAAPDRYGVLLGLTSSALAQFTTVSADRIGPYKIVVSPQLDAGTIVVGDSSGLLVAETPGAPVELKVVEPAIGGFEVGIIGAFEAVVADPGAFSLITTAS